MGENSPSAVEVVESAGEPGGDTNVACLAAATPSCAGATGGGGGDNGSILAVCEILCQSRLISGP
jgi:hypothetical protein